MELISSFASQLRSTKANDEQKNRNNALNSIVSPYVIAACALVTCVPVASFDVSKCQLDFSQDLIDSIQQRCKRVLADSKQKMFVSLFILSQERETHRHAWFLTVLLRIRLATAASGEAHDRDKIVRVWFYEDNPLLRNKVTLLTLNESNRSLLISREEKDIISMFSCRKTEGEIPSVHSATFDS